jgi:hypothetical protein
MRIIFSSAIVFSISFLSLTAQFYTGVHTFEKIKRKKINIKKAQT